MSPRPSRAEFNLAGIISGGISGSLTVSCTKNSAGQYVLAVGGMADMHASIFGIFGVDIGFGFYLSTDGHISFDVHVSLHILFFTISISFTVENWNSL